MKELKYPFNSEYLLKKRRSIKKDLLKGTGGRLKKRIAILGGSTTHDLKEMLELFLLDCEIEPLFYESEYGQYWQDVMFDNPELAGFHPDLILVHTSSRNILRFPTVRNTEDETNDMIERTYRSFEEMWAKIEDTYKCPIIQNNFEPPFYRLLGNRDGTDFYGRINFINRMNEKLYQYARKHKSFFINDIHYMASCYGVQRWADPFYWHMYKYACAVAAIPELAYNISNIIKAIYGKNKKAMVVDLDNTLWGGVVGDDGADNIEIGQETSVGQAFSEFQDYIKAHKDLGILLTVASKNDESNALAGLQRPDSRLKPEDFLIIKANWENKDRNIMEIAKELNVGLDSLVFIDDNPAERHMVKSQIPEVEVPEIGDIAQYIQILDRSGFFEMVGLSEDDLNRNQMYQTNIKRNRQKASYKDYSEYLISLDMEAEINPFSSVYMSRIAQLTNKSNQFNLTTMRCSQSDIESYASNPMYITLYGKLRDKFGDNGVVSIVFGHVDLDDSIIFHIDLWLMSCRVLKRGMEYAMMDELVRQCLIKEIRCLKGYYYPTAKNAMVKEFYGWQGFTKVSEDDMGNTVWEYWIHRPYENKNRVIRVNS